jgi:hypothetical protein
MSNAPSRPWNSFFFDFFGRNAPQWWPAPRFFAKHQAARGSKATIPSVRARTSGVARQLATAS